MTKDAAMTMATPTVYLKAPLGSKAVQLKLRMLIVFLLRQNNHLLPAGCHRRLGSWQRNRCRKKTHHLSQLLSGLGKVILLLLKGNRRSS